MSIQPCPHFANVDLKQLKHNKKELKKIAALYTYCEGCSPELFENQEEQEDKIKQLRPENENKGGSCICLTCFSVGCGRSDEKHAIKHFERFSDHSVTLNVRTL
jgi:uncharacterized UBP type Zn finger protein